MHDIDPILVQNEPFHLFSLLIVSQTAWRLRGKCDIWWVGRWAASIAVSHQIFYFLFHWWANICSHTFMLSANVHKAVNMFDLAHVFTHQHRHRYHHQYIDKLEIVIEGYFPQNCHLSTQN